MMGAVCLLGMLLVMCDEMGLEFDWSRLFFVSRYAMHPNYYARVPFVDDSLDAWIAILGGTLALALGFWQSLGETFRKTWSFLWHRPMQRQHVTYVKLSVGAAVFAGAMCPPLLILSVWASIPGTGMCPPRRYTASNPRVNRTRFRRSGILNTLVIASKNFILPPEP